MALSQDSLKMEFPELELLEINQLNLYESNRFDLSGLVIHDQRFYVVADKGHNNYIYEIQKTNASGQDRWDIIGTINLGIFDLIDLEGIDYCDGVYYLINEIGNKVYALTSDEQLIELSINFYLKKIDVSTWDSNAGLEGIAVDCEHDIIYLAKERGPRRLFAIEKKYGNITSDWNIPETESNDFADLKFENGFLYGLERNGNYIAKIDVKTLNVVSKVSYKHVASHENGKLYTPSKFGMAEALAFTKEYIYIGIDNNGLSVSTFAKETYGMGGNQPAILKFVRPEGF